MAYGSLLKAETRDRGITREELVEFLKENLGVGVDLKVTREWNDAEYITARVTISLLGEEIAACEASELLSRG